MTGTELPYGGNSQNKQDIVNNPGQAIVDMRGGVAIGQIGQLMIYFSQNPTESAVVKPDTSKLGVNPYRGLLAFGEMDGDRFFGREVQIAQLWEKFHNLHQDQSTVRVLPIYGPSGSGKSSLARAGLIPALGKKPLPGRDRARLAVLVPGTHPLEALATVLARVATNDLTPVAKSQEFEQVLKTKNDEGKYEGLRRIADALPDIAASPLIVLVDQFEEVYTYALTTDRTQRDAFIAERDALIENLLCAAAERSQRVSVIITLRSDFLGETQQHPRLNKLFSTQGFLVPIMQPEELEIAIAKPAAQAGHQLDKAIVKLLVEQTQGREGALPLLQFALTRIWEGLQNKVDPAETLHNIGGVGGALAGEAQRLYQSLKPEDQAIARSIFLALVQVSEDSGDTRRRAPVSELIPTDGDKDHVWSIIKKFADPGVRFLVTFSDKQQGEMIEMIEMIEVAHEALIRNWEQLKEWLKECREALRKKRKIEEAAEDWKCHKKSKDYLIQGRSLRNAKEFMQGATKETALSSLATEFVTSSQQHFALTKIWEGLRNSVILSDTLELEQIGGIGGELANEAKSVYDSLKPEQQKIARSIFLALIQLNDDYQNTRRRATVSNLITSKQDEFLVREVMDSFTHPGVWILCPCSTEEQVEISEITHEALICNWKDLQHWLKEHWAELRKKREIEQVALEWQNKQKSKDYLLQGRSLRDARKFLQAQKENTETSLSSLATKFVKASQKKERRDTITKILTTFIAPSIVLTPLIFHFTTLFIASKVLYQNDCELNLMTNFFLQYQVNYGGKRELSGLRLCKEYLSIIDLSGAKLDLLSDTDFSQADLSSANFFKSTVKNIRLDRAKLENTNFQEALFIKSSFQNVDFSEANIRKAIFIEGDFNKTSFKKNPLMENAIFIKADLSNTDLDVDELSIIKICHSKLPEKIPEKIGDINNRDCSNPKVHNYLELAE